MCASIHRKCLSGVKMSLSHEYWLRNSLMDMAHSHLLMLSASLYKPNDNNARCFDEEGTELIGEREMGRMRKEDKLFRKSLGAVVPMESSSPEENKEEEDVQLLATFDVVWYSGRSPLLYTTLRSAFNKGETAVVVVITEHAAMREICSQRDRNWTNRHKNTDKKITKNHKE